MSGKSCLVFLQIQVLIWFLMATPTNGAAEYADVTENLFKIAGPVLEALKDPKIQPYFRSLSVRFRSSSSPFVAPVVHFSNRYTRRSRTSPVSAPASFPRTGQSELFFP